MLQLETLALLRPETLEIYSKVSAVRLDLAAVSDMSFIIGVCYNKSAVVPRTFTSSYLKDMENHTAIIM